MAVRVTRAGVGLTIGIIILALVVLGGLYLVKQRGEQARREDAIQVAQENLESQSETGVITPSIDGDSETTTGNDDGTSTPPADTEADDQDKTQQDQDEVAELPATGASDIYGLLVVGLLAFASVSYITSRRLALERS